jgi:hypothetical protein
MPGAGSTARKSERFAPASRVLRFVCEAVGAVRVMLHVPHASTVIPDDVRAARLLVDSRGSPSGSEQRIRRVLFAASAASQRSCRPAEMVAPER